MVLEKLKLQKSNVISIVNDLIYLLENSAKNSDVEFILKRKDIGKFFFFYNFLFWIVDRKHFFFS